MNPTTNRQQLSTSFDRLRSALSKLDKADSRSGTRSTRTDDLYTHAIQTLDALATSIEDPSTDKFGEPR